MPWSGTTEGLVLAAVSCGDRGAERALRGLVPALRVAVEAKLAELAALSPEQRHGLLARAADGLGPRPGPSPSRGLARALHGLAAASPERTARERRWLAMVTCRDGRDGGEDDRAL